MQTNSSRRSLSDRILRATVYFMWLVAAVAFVIAIYARSLDWFFCSIVWAVGATFSAWVIREDEDYEAETNHPFRG
jgi:uncharacterized membrane protein